MSEGMKSFLFALVLCLVCSLLLTGAYVGLRPYQQQNVRIERQKHVLRSVGLVEPGKRYSADEIERLFSERIRCLRVFPDGRRLPEGVEHPRELPVYLNIGPDRAIENYIIPIHTKGVWGDIKGYLALDRDGRTIAAFTVYSHSETPGLGGEIEREWFQNNFVGKRIVDQANDFVAVAVARGTVADQVPLEKQIHYVDGISGATLTGEYLSRGLYRTLREYEPVSLRFRQGELEALQPGQEPCQND